MDGPPEPYSEKAPTGVPGLDEILRGGLPLNRTTLVAGGHPSACESPEMARRPPSRATTGQRRIEALIGSIRDAEQELQAITGGQSERFAAGTQRAILDALPAHVALLDANGVIRTVNAAWRRFGEENESSDAEHGVGQNYLTVCDTAVGGGSEGAHEIAAGLRGVLSDALPSFALEYTCHAPAVERWFHVMITPVRDEHVIGAVAMHVDVSDRRIAEHDLEVSRSLQAIAARIGRIGGWSAAIPSFEIQWSPEVFAIHDRAPGILPDPLEAFGDYSPESREQLQRAFETCATTRKPFDLELELALPSGVRRSVRVIGQPEVDAAGVVRAIRGATQDITQQKTMEQQFLRAQRMESVGTLAGGIAHDLNNALTPILMSVDLLRLDETDPEQLSILAGIESSARRGADMVRQVLTFARGADGRRVTVQVRSLVRDIEKIVRETFPKNIDVRLTMANSIWPVTGDPTQLHQVLINLCVNARDAMLHGGQLTITVSELILDEHYAGMNNEAKLGPHVVIEIEDSGTGMTAEVLDKIFEPFFTTKELGKGTGLGLSTSIAIVKSHGGFLRAYSEPGRGSRFRVYLPADTEAGSGPMLLEPPVAPHGQGELILIVDDEISVREITRQTLETFGYRVLTASDGADGVAMFATHRKDIALVLTDMMMPVMDGPSMIEVLVRMDPKVRIVATSGLHTHAHSARAHGNVLHFLPKPYTAESMLTSLRRALDS